MINENSLSDALRETFPVGLRAFIEGQPLSEDALTPAEREALASLVAPIRRESWLRGRGALKRLRAAAGEDPDTAALRFPHPRISLSHSGAWAVAVAVTGGETLGVGVDVELGDPPKTEAARRFLNAGELVWLRRREEEEKPRILHRLWTVKEATFKADPENAGKTLRDYALADPGYVAGKARRGDRAFLYATFDVPGGFLSVAVLPAVQ